MEILSFHRLSELFNQEIGELRSTSIVCEHLDQSMTIISPIKHPNRGQTELQTPLNRMRHTRGHRHITILNFILACCVCLNIARNMYTIVPEAEVNTGEYSLVIQTEAKPRFVY